MFVGAWLLGNYIKLWADFLALIAVQTQKCLHRNQQITFDLKNFIKHDSISGKIWTNFYLKIKNFELNSFSKSFMYLYFSINVTFYIIKVFYG